MSSANGGRLGASKLAPDYAARQPSARTIADKDASPQIAGKLAATKLRPPCPPAGSIARSRLFRSIDRGVKGTLTLVVGPAGSGKTVLVSDCAARAEMPVGWLALDATDATSQRFWGGLAHALREAGVSGLRAAHPGAGYVEDSFVADVVDALIAHDEAVALVLDDFHEVAPAVCACVRPLCWSTLRGRSG